MAYQVNYPPEKTLLELIQETAKTEFELNKGALSNTIFTINERADKLSFISKEIVEQAQIHNEEQKRAQKILFEDQLLAQRTELLLPNSTYIPILKRKRQHFSNLSDQEIELRESLTSVFIAHQTMKFLEKLREEIRDKRKLPKRTYTFEQFFIGGKEVSNQILALPCVAECISDSGVWMESDVKLAALVIDLRNKGYFYSKRVKATTAISEAFSKKLGIKLTSKYLQPDMINKRVSKYIEEFSCIPAYEK